MLESALTLDIFASDNCGNFRSVFICGKFGGDIFTSGNCGNFISDGCAAGIVGALRDEERN
jgi:hypothetical protein